jgi:hypothetical protein
MRVMAGQGSRRRRKKARVTPLLLNLCVDRHSVTASWALCSIFHIVSRRDESDHVKRHSAGSQFPRVSRCRTYHSPKLELRYELATPPKFRLIVGLPPTHTPTLAWEASTATLRSRVRPPLLWQQGTICRCSDIGVLVRRANTDREPQLEERRLTF